MGVTTVTSHIMMQVKVYITHREYVLFFYVCGGGIFV